MRIAYILLVHERPDIVARLASRLMLGDSIVVVHWDAKAGNEPVTQLKSALAQYGDRLLFAERVNVRWGNWTMIQATLNCIERLMESGFSAEYVYLISGSEYPIRSHAELASFLERNRGTEYIESWPADRVRWVAGGIQEERYLYRFPFNWRSQHQLALKTLRLQQKHKLKRSFPTGFHPHIGSQWWLLTGQTVRELAKTSKDKSLIRFFKHTLIPDELYFQTLVRSLVDHTLIANRTLTYFQFTDYFVPYVFYNRHFDYLCRQPFFFARKISNDAESLKDKLDEVWSEGRHSPTHPDFTMGIRTTEYSDFIFAHRYGAFGTRQVINDFMAHAAIKRHYRHNSFVGSVFTVAGINGSEGWYSKNRWYRKPVFVLIGNTPESLNSVRSLLAQRYGLKLFGQLFAEKEIDFGNGIDEFAGYKRTATLLRDDSPRDFLLDVISAMGDCDMGFCLLFQQAEKLMPLLVDELNMKAMIVQEDSVCLSEDELHTFRADTPHGAFYSPHVSPEAVLWRQSRLKARVQDLTLLVKQSHAPLTDVLSVSKTDIEKEPDRESTILDFISPLCEASLIAEARRAVRSKILSSLWAVTDKNLSEEVVKHQSR